jgi:hypothetical protein
VSVFASFTNEARRQRLAHAIQSSSNLIASAAGSR